MQTKTISTRSKSSSGGQSQKQKGRKNDKITVSLPPDPSAVGAHMEEETAIAALAYRYYQEEGCPEGRQEEHWNRAREELERRRFSAPTAKKAEAKPTAMDIQVEEAMHLGR